MWCEKEQRACKVFLGGTERVRLSGNMLPYLVDILAEQRFHGGLFTTGICLLHYQRIA